MDKIGESWDSIHIIAFFLRETGILSMKFSENGEIKLAGLTESVAVIAVDKHGNESKPVILRR